jgi:hypothetical protein
MDTPGSKIAPRLENLFQALILKVPHAFYLIKICPLNSLEIIMFFGVPVSLTKKNIIISRLFNGVEITLQPQTSEFHSPLTCMAT